MTMGLIAGLAASAGAAVDFCVDGDFSYGDATGWAEYTEAWGAQDYVWDVTDGVGTLSLTSGTLCWYQVMDVPAGITVNCSGEWMSTMAGNDWWAEIMLFSFADMDAECIDNHGNTSTCLEAAIDQPGTIDGDVVTVRSVSTTAASAEWRSRRMHGDSTRAVPPGAGNPAQIHPWAIPALKASDKSPSF